MNKFDIKTIYNKKRPYSWSAESSFHYNKGQWYLKYVVHGKCTYLDEKKGTVDFCVIAGFADLECPVVKKSPELIFGSMIDKKVQDDPTFLPELVRYPVMQHKMEAIFEGIPLIGYSDMYHPELPGIRDVKTGRKPWTQARADGKDATKWNQFDMYLFMLYKMKLGKPEEYELHVDWLPTHIEDGKVAFIKEGQIVTFKTKRTMRQVLAFGQRIKDTWAAMEEYAGRQAGYSSNSLTDW